MGYGEVGGGGSVKWTMVHGSSGGGVGFDPNPPKGQGIFVVKIDTGNGPPQVIGPFDVQENPRQIQIVWAAKGGAPLSADALLEDELNKARTEARRRAEDLGTSNIPPGTP